VWRSADGGTRVRKVVTYAALIALAAASRSQALSPHRGCWASLEPPWAFDDRHRDRRRARLSHPDRLTLAAFLLGLADAAAKGIENMPEAIAIAAMQGFALALAFFALREIYRRLRHRQGIGLATSSSPPLLAPGSTGRSFRPPSKSPRSRRCSHISRASSSFGVACRRPRNCHSGYFSRRRFGFVGCSARWYCKVKGTRQWGFSPLREGTENQPGHLPGTAASSCESSDGGV